METTGSPREKGELMKKFTHKRKIATSPREVFAAFENQALLAQWYGPEGFTTTTQSFQFKPGGKWVFVMHGPQGADYPNEMIFQEITPPQKIVLRHSIPPFFTATVLIEDDEEGALVTFHQEFDSEEVALKMAHIVQPANEQVLNKLQALLEAGSPSPMDK